MKFFLDTANLDEIRKGAEWGTVDGVTTNPTLIAKEGKPIRDGIDACSALSKEGIRVNVTLCLSLAQALIAAKARAYFSSPFVGRIDDIGGNEMDLVRQIVAIYDNYDFETQILAASLRGPTHVIEWALAGAHIGTMPFKVMDLLFNQFLRNYSRTIQSEPAGATR